MMGGIKKKQANQKYISSYVDDIIISTALKRSEDINIVQADLKNNKLGCRKYDFQKTNLNC